MPINVTRHVVGLVAVVLVAVSVLGRAVSTTAWLRRRFARHSC